MSAKARRATDRRLSRIESSASTIVTIRHQLVMRDIKRLTSAVNDPTWQQYVMLLFALSHSKMYYMVQLT